MEKKQLCKEVIEKIDMVSDLLYQQHIQEGFSMIGELTKDITVGLSQLQTASQQKILEAMKIAFQAIENKDGVLLADVFYYEVRCEFERCMGER